MCSAVRFREKRKHPSPSAHIQPGEPLLSRLANLSPEEQAAVEAAKEAEVAAFEAEALRGTEGDGGGSESGVLVEPAELPRGAVARSV